LFYVFYVARVSFLAQNTSSPVTTYLGVCIKPVTIVIHCAYYGVNIVMQRFLSTTMWCNAFSERSMEECQQYEVMIAARGRSIS
jgi:hypothetical protein